MKRQDMTEAMGKAIEQYYMRNQLIFHQYEMAEAALDAFLEKLPEPTEMAFERASGFNDGDLYQQILALKTKGV